MVALTAFDGDRVMAIFMGEYKNTNATKCALKIHYLVTQINKAITAQYPQTSFTLAHSIGIDTSKLLVAKTGECTATTTWFGLAQLLTTLPKWPT